MRDAAPRYFSLSIPSDGGKGLWLLDVRHLNPDGSWKDVWAFTRGEHLTTPPILDFFVTRAGAKADFNEGPFGILLVNKRFADIVEAHAGKEVQRIPTTFEGGGWEILNVLPFVPCFDHKGSYFVQYYAADYPDKTKVGKVQGVIKLRILPEKAEGHTIFYVEEWPVALIVNAKLADALTAAGMTGFKLTPVA